MGEESGAVDRGASAYDLGVFAFLQRDAPGIAQAYFPGSAPPPLEAFGRLREQLIEIEPLRAGEEGVLWEAKLRHPEWGEARIACLRDAPSAIGVFRQLAAEFEPYGVHVLAKLGLATRSGGREHLWFEVHGFGDADLDGTLVNRPIDVDLREGARARYPLDLLTDWTIVTPIGEINPRSQLVARNLRTNGAEVLEAMRRG